MWENCDFSYMRKNPIQIGYFLPKEVHSAYIQLSNLHGQILKQVALTQRGEGVVSIASQNLPVGTYVYSMVIDGKVIKTLRMRLEN